MKIRHSLAFLAIAFAGHAHAGDPSCAPLEKAAKLALAQPLIHRVGELPMPGEVGKPGAAKILMHTIFVGDTHYSDLMGNSRFSTDKTASAGEKASQTLLVTITDIEGKCRALGSATIAGRSTAVYEFGSRATRDDMYFKTWIDTKTGFPIAQIADQAVPEGGGGLQWGKAKPAPAAKPANTRMVSKMSFIYGDMVKAPVLTGSANIMGTKAGKMNAGAVAELAALINAVQ